MESGYPSHFGLTELIRNWIFHIKFHWGIGGILVPKPPGFLSAQVASKASDTELAPESDEMEEAVPEVAMPDMNGEADLEG